MAEKGESLRDPPNQGISKRSSIYIGRETVVVETKLLSRARRRGRGVNGRS